MSAAVTLSSGAAPDTAREGFKAALSSYFSELGGASIVNYHRIAALLMSVSGISDYTLLTVNGSTQNITVGAEYVPVVGEVVLTV